MGAAPGRSAHPLSLPSPLELLPPAPPLPLVAAAADAAALVDPGCDAHIAFVAQSAHWHPSMYDSHTPSSLQCEGSLQNSSVAQSTQVHASSSVHALSSTH